jgi:cell division protein FtsL
MEAFEYAIKKDIRNNAIVREIDRTRQRELWHWTAVGAFFVILLLCNAWQHFELLRHGYLVEQMQNARRQEEDVNRHLRLQVEALKSPTRIARLAESRLHMAPPGPGDAIVLERALPAEPPARSVVAQR